MQNALKILILEDSTTDAALIQRLLTKENPAHQFSLAMNKQDFLKALTGFSPDVILSDNSLPQFSSNEALQITRERFSDVPFILVTGTVSDEFAAGIITAGADDYILKDRMTRLPAAINAAIKKRRVEKEIRDYRYAIDHTSIVAITDQKGIITYANENFSKISKYRVDELIGQDHRIINSGYHPASFIKKLWTTIARGKTWKGEFRNRAKDGSFYWVDTSIIPFLNENGKPYQYLSIRVDISQRKKTEEELIQSEIKYRTIFLKSPLPKWIFDLQTLRFLDVNEAALQHYGYTHKEFLSMTIKDIRPKEEMQQLFTDLSMIPGEPYTSHGSWTHRKKNGELITVETTSHFIDYDNRKARMVIVNDITEKIKAEKALLQSEIRLKEAQAIAHIGNWEVDLVSNTNLWSDEFYRIYGLTRDEIKPSADSFLSFMHPEDAGYAQKMVEEAFVSLANSSFNFRFIRKDGAIRHGYTEWQFEFDKKGTPLRLFGIIQDVTERKHAEEELNKLETALFEQQRQEQVKITATALEAQEKERNAIGTELHDNVNQILVGTKLLLSLIKTSPEQIQQLIDSCMNNLQQAIDENRKIAHELVAPDFEEKGLKDLLSELTHIMLKRSGIGVTIDTTRFRKGLLEKQQKLAIYRIAQEQCTNIVKYAKAKQVNISLTSTGKIFTMIIADDGVGMKTGGQTDGIGLRNIKGRLSIFNGTASIKTAPGKGFELKISFPLGS